MRFLLSYICFSIVALSSVFSQGVTLFGIDPTNFPIISAKVFVFDSLGTIITPTVNDFRIEENQNPRTVRVLQCTNMDTAKKLSIVVTADVSGSMSWGASGVSNMTLLKEGTKKITNLLPFDSEIALTAFDNSQYLLQDFTKKKEVLLSKIPLLKPQGGTNYDQALWVPLAGAIPVAKNGKNKRIVLFITDGQGGGDAQKIVRDAQQDSVTIYCITLSMSAPASLYYIANQTNGKVFQNISTIEQMTAVIQQIFLEAIEVTPCQIEWDGFITCLNGNRDVSATYKPSNSSDSGQYIAPRDLAVKELQVYPKQVTFFNKPLNQQYDTTIKVIAKNGNVSVSNIVTVNADYTVSPRNFSLTSGDSVFLTLSYFPKDSGFTFTELRFQTAECGEQLFYASGGFRGKRPKFRTLKVDFPNGRDQLLAGTDSIIRWSGITSLDTVSLEYSFDKGKTWNLITRQGAGLAFFWKNIPLPTSALCLMRVKQLSSAPLDSIRSYQLHRESVIDGVASPKEDKFITVSQDNFVYMWDVFTGDTVKRLRYGNAGVPNIVLYNNKATQFATAHSNRSIFMWSTLINDTLFSLRGHTSGINHLSFSQDDSLLLSSSNDRSVRVWYSRTGALLATLGYHTDIVHSAAVSDDRTKIATASRDGFLRIWDAKTYDTIAIFKADGWGMEQCGFFRNNRWVYGSSDEKTVVFDIVSKTFLYVVGGMEATLNRSGTKMFTISNDRIVRCWSSTNGNLLVAYIGHTGNVIGYQLSPDETKILTYADDRTARIFDVESGEQLAVVRHETFNTPFITKAFFTHLGDYFITTSIDRSARLWSADVLPLQQDTSDNVWSIVRPTLSARNIEFPAQVVGTSRDSMFMSYTLNASQYDASIDTVWVESSLPNEFEIVSSAGKQMVLANNSLPIEVRFTPKQQGLREGLITIRTPSDTLEYTVKGIGLESSLELISNYVDFGEVNLYQQKDSIRIALAVNRGSASVDVLGTSIIEPNTVDFLPLQQMSTLTLQPGDTLYSDMAFRPNAIGRTSGRVAIAYDKIGSPLFAPLFGTGINKGAEMQVTIANFAPITCETEQRATLTVTNNGISSLSIISVSPIGVNASDFEIVTFPQTVEPNESGSIEVLFKPQSFGTKQADIVIRSNSITDTVLSIPIQARKDVIDIKTPSAIDIGTVCFGTVVPFEIEVTNIGSLAATLSYTPTIDNRTETTSNVDLGSLINLQCTYNVTDPVGSFTKEIYITNSFCGEIDTVLITGTIIHPQLEIQPLQIFAIVGTQKKGYIRIENTSTTDISIPQFSLSSPFTLDSSFTELVVVANQSVFVPVIYNAITSTTSTEAIVLVGNLCRVSDTLRVEGIPTQAAIVLQIGSAKGYPGDKVTIPVSIVSETNTEVLGVQPEIEFTIQYNGSLLFPEKNGGLVSKGGTREETLRYALDEQKKPIIDQMNFEVMLGNDTITSISVLTSVATNAPIDVTVLPGTFTLLGICDAGGNRLVFGNDTTINVAITYRQQEVVVTVSMIEHGQHELNMFSSIGVKVIEPLQFNNIGVQIKSIIVPLQAFTKGLYFLQLKTPSQQKITPFLNR